MVWAGKTLLLCYPLVTDLTVVTVLSCFDIGIAADVPPTSEVRAFAMLLQMWELGSRVIPSYNDIGIPRTTPRL
jgi:hypothetical protein